MGWALLVGLAQRLLQDEHAHLVLLLRAALRALPPFKPSSCCSEQLAEQSESVPSVDNLEFVMESLALGHTVLDQKTVSGGNESSRLWARNIK